MSELTPEKRTGKQVAASTPLNSEFKFDSVQSGLIKQMQSDLRGPAGVIGEIIERLLKKVEDLDLKEFTPDIILIKNASNLLFQNILNLLDPDQAGILIERDGWNDYGSHLRHELRNPINGIMGYSEMLLEDAEEEGKQLVEDLQLIHEKAKKFLSSIDRVIPITEAGSPEETKNSNIKPDPKINPIEIPASSPPFTNSDNGKKNSILVVDDNALNRNLLSRRLEKKGYKVTSAVNGLQALEKVRMERFDLILLDVIMPEVNGFEVLRQMKADRELRHIPVLMISALDELDGVVRCIEMGAADYLMKPFNPVLLNARISACLERKNLRDRERVMLKERDEAYQALLASQNTLKTELEEANKYVISLLPEKLNTPVLATDWVFIPSTQLGGDSFGYHWIDENRFAAYLIDVCGHGVGAALLSVSAINVLRSQSLDGINFTDPKAVLEGLNEAFEMEKHNQMYFTIWYGVYDRERREMAYSSGGHPPAILVGNPSVEERPIKMLKTAGMVVGGISGMTFESAATRVAPGSRLYLFSDGVYELEYADGRGLMTIDEFADELANPNSILDSQAGNKVASMVPFAQKVQGRNNFDDDFSLLEIRFF